MAYQSFDPYEGKVLKTFEELIDQQLKTERLFVDGSHHTVDAWVIRTERSLMVRLTDHALPRHAIKTDQVQIQLTGAPERSDAYVVRIDRNLANVERPWSEAGAPEFLSVPEVERLRAAPRICQEPQRSKSVNGDLCLNALPPQAVAAIPVEFASRQAGGGVPA